MLKSLWDRLAKGTTVEVPDDLWTATLAALPFAARLTAPERERLRSLAGDFLRNKEMAGAAGLELTAAMQVSIAAQACLPVLKLGLEWYRGWNSIVVYPGEFLVPRRVTDDDGVVHEYSEPITGEAWDGGPLGLKPGEDSMRRLLSRHPDYLEQVQAFIAADPLAARRQAIVEALDRAGCRLG